MIRLKHNIEYEVVNWYLEILYTLRISDQHVMFHRTHSREDSFRWVITLKG